MADVLLPKTNLLRPSAHEGNVAEQGVATVVDLRLAKLRRMRNRQLTQKYSLILSPLVAQASADRAMVTCYSDPDLVDRIALVLAIPTVADSGHLQDEELTAPIAIVSGRTYLWLPMFGCCVFYSVHQDSKNVELQGVFRDCFGPNGPKGGIRLDSTEQLYLRMIANHPLRRSPRRAIGGLLLVVVCFGGMLAYAASIHRVEERDSISALPPTTIVSDIGTRKGDREKTATTYAEKSSSSGDIARFESNLTSFQSRWSALIENNDARWAKLLSETLPKDEITTSAKTAISNPTDHTKSSIGRHLISSPHSVAAPATLSTEQSANGNSEEVGYIASKENSPPPVSLARMAIVRRN